MRFTCMHIYQIYYKWKSMHITSLYNLFDCTKLCAKTTYLFTPSPQKWGEKNRQRERERNRVRPCIKANLLAHHQADTPQWLLTLQISHQELSVHLFHAGKSELPLKEHPSWSNQIFQQKSKYGKTSIYSI